MKLPSFFRRKAEIALVAPRPTLRFFNTLGREKQVFDLPEDVHTVRMYNCGPTLYGRQHIGNLSMFVFADTLRRVLEYNGFIVKQVINFTDFGHLSSDSDDGDDKMTIGLKREKLKPTLENMRLLAEKYAKVFLDDLQTLNISTKKIIFPYASDHVSAQIAMIRTLEEKGYAYKGGDGVYFDTARFPHYGELGGLSVTNTEARVEARTAKRNAADFVLWKSSEKIGWESPWGKGFPGWHIECSAMIRAILGEKIDIHTGGIEHIPIHHNNEIAQSECTTGKRPFSRFWLHRAHLQIDGGKIAKSSGKVIYMDEIVEKYHPLAFRYLLLTAHYRASQNFSWESLESAQTAFLKLRAFVDKNADGGAAAEIYRLRIEERLNDDLDTAGALAVIWEMMKDVAIAAEDKRATILDADRVLGLNLGSADARASTLSAAAFGTTTNEADLPDNVRELVARRNAARDEKKWDEADTLRKEIESLGYTLEDSSEGLRVLKRL